MLFIYLFQTSFFQIYQLDIKLSDPFPSETPYLRMTHPALLTSQPPASLFTHLAAAVPSIFYDTTWPMCYKYKILIRGFLTRLDVRTLRLQMLQEITEIKKRTNIY